MKKLAILSTHPIQYNAPLFRRMAAQEDWNVHVFFSRTLKQVSYDPDFQCEVAWDTPLTEGYVHSHVDATASSGVEELKRAIGTFRPNALLVYGWNFPGHRQVMRAFHGRVPIGFRGDSHLLNPAPFWRRWIRRSVLRKVYRHVDLAFSVGTANTAYFQWSGVPTSKIALAPHAVDNAYWHKDSDERQQAAGQWKAELGILETAPVIGFAGKLEPLKQVDRLIEAFKQVTSSQAHLVIAGTGPDDAKLRHQAASHPRIHFVGFVNQSRMPIFYRMLSVFALPSSSETWGLSVNEALACGTRCVVSDHVGCGPDLFRDPNLGAIVAWDRPTEWAPVLDNMLYHTDLKGESLDAFLKTYSYQAMLDALPKLWSP